MLMPKYASLYERLIANSVKPDELNENGCWVWTGRTDGKRGGSYGRMNVYIAGEVSTVQPHRVMEGIFQLHADQDGEPHEFDPLSLFVLLDPDTETIEHLCWNVKCINPDHWILVDRSTNAALMQSRRKALQR